MIIKICAVPHLSHKMGKQGAFNETSNTHSYTYRHTGTHTHRHTEIQIYAKTHTQMHIQTYTYTTLTDGGGRETHEKMNLKNSFGTD